MSLEDHEIIELHELLDALVENNLPKDKLRKLEQWIEDNEEVRRYYIEFIDMSASLGHYAEELVSDETEDCITDSSNNLLSFWKPVAAVAALLTFGLFFFKDSNNHFWDQAPPVTVKKTEQIDSLTELINNKEIVVDTVAVLTKSVGVVWADSAKFRPSLGDTLEPCKLELTKGLAQIEFLQGATVVLEGPIEFSINNPNEGVLSSGKIRAIVPRVATGFTIAVPHGRVIDLGTDFGVHVHSGGSTELFVYQGKVVYEGKTVSGESIIREVTGGESIFIDPYGNANWVEMPTEPFISAADLAFRSMEESQRRHSAWVDLSNSIAADPNTHLYFSFDNHSPWSRILKNESISKPSVQNGAIVGCKWNEGRWSGKGALTFKRKNDRVRLELPSHLKSATFSAWVKIESFVNTMAPIICSEPSTLGSICWSINRNGQIVLRTKNKNGNVFYESAVAFGREKMGRWSHIATTYDGELKKISHFVNGRPFSREKLNDSVVLTFPNAMLGHSNALPNQKNGVAFNGSIDEFGIFEGVYNEEQIRNIYEVGRPFEVPNALAPHLP